MKKLIQVLAIGTLLLVLLPGMVWASPGKPPTARDQVRELCASPVWAKNVLDFDQGPRLDDQPVLEERSNPRKALRQPDDKFVSLGFGGSITVTFKDPIANNPGPEDLYVLAYEITWFKVSPNYPLEVAEVYLIGDGKEVLVGTVDNSSSGTGPGILSIVTIPEDLDYVQAVKLQDVTDREPFVGKTWEGWYNADAFDLDAVGTCFTSSE